MTIDTRQWRRIDDVFAAASELPAGERAVYLDAVCAGEPALRERLDRLLAAMAESADFLEQPAAGMLGLALVEGEDRDEGARLGPYLLLRRIGAGGMGTVYLARREDDHYQRDVAVKILRSGLTGEVLRRFLAERQILGRLEHPNIARLYDSGTTLDGRPYFIMELVEGMPVDEYCDRHRLTVRQRLELFRRMCRAVQHAHENLLVHRDLKPGNVLVTAEGEPKLLDFGIAKRLAGDVAVGPPGTRTGWRMLTPDYASPEQVRGEAITTASDVFSLGVVLYELLTGRSPYPETGSAPYEIERAICEMEAERPSLALLRSGRRERAAVASARGTRPRALRRSLQGDLDTIVLTALQKDPRRRYTSAAQLAEDLERHLQHQPVRARPDTLWYRARKLVRRHRTGAAAATLVALVAAGFAVSLVLQDRQITQERDKASYALSFLVDTFKQADPYQARGERLTAREILDRGASRVSRELSGRPDVQAAVLDAIGEVDLGLGRYEVAEPLVTRALALRRRAAGVDSLEVAESLHHLATIKSERSQLAAAEELLRKALTIRRHRLGDEDLEVARTINALGDLLVARGASPREVEDLEGEALAIARKVEGPSGLTVADTLLHLARAKQAAGDYGGAQALYAEALGIEARVLPRDDPRSFRDLTAFGEFLIEIGKPIAAEVVLRRSLAAERKSLGDAHPDTAETLANLAMAVYQQDRFAEAEALNREVLRLVRSHFGPSHWIITMVLGNLAASLQSAGKTAEAKVYLEEVLELRRRTLGERHPLVAQAMLLLAGCDRELGDVSAALPLARRALAILEFVDGPRHLHVAYATREIGRIYMAQKRFGAAELYLRRSLEIRRLQPQVDPGGQMMAETSLGECLLELGRFDEAAAVLRRPASFGTDPLSSQAKALLARSERLRQERP